MRKILKPFAALALILAAGACLFDTSAWATTMVPPYGYPIMVTGVSQFRANNYSGFPFVILGGYSSVGDAGSGRLFTPGGCSSDDGISCIKDAGNTYWSATSFGGRYPDGDITSLALGVSALNAQTSAANGYNLALGYHAGINATSSQQSVFLGGAAGANVTAGNKELAIGYSALGGSGTLTGNFNTALGWEALLNATGAAAENICIGAVACEYLTTGTFNTAVGDDVLGSRSAVTLTGADNTVMGWNTGGNLQGSASFNSFFGYQAGLNDTTGGQNVLVGYDSGEYVSTAAATTCIGTLACEGTSGTPLTGNYNTALGYQTLQSLQGGADGNTAEGYQAGNALTTGSFNVANGYGAQEYLTSGVGNVSSGTLSLEGSATNAVTGNDNIAEGYQAGQNISSGSHNIGFGYQALLGTPGAPLTGNYNIALGGHAGLSVQGAAFGNVLLGANTGYDLTTGSRNLILGYTVASTTLATGSDEILIGTSSNCDAASAGESDTFRLCASGGATPVIAASLANGSQAVAIGGATIEGLGTLDIAGAYYDAGSAGVSCSGSPTSSFASAGGIVTHC